jgi:cytochrome c553
MMRKSLMLTALTLLASSIQAADVEGGKAMGSTVCAACHGANGVSVSSRIPHLAGQRAAYVASQLEAFRSGSRKSPLMAIIAKQLSPDERVNVAAYFAAQPGAAPDAKSPLPAYIANTQVILPPAAKIGYRRYFVKDYPENKQVALYFANDAAMQAAAAGKALPDGSEIVAEVHSAKLDGAGTPVVGADGHFVPDQLQSLTGMAREARWGKDIPAMLRNDNWNYAVFNSDRSRRTDLNLAECLVCHSTKKDSSFLFLYSELAAASHSPVK